MTALWVLASIIKGFAMLNRFALAALLLLAASCSREWDGRRSGGLETQDASAAPAALTAASAAVPSAAMRVRTGQGFARLPDRGELLTYDRTRPVQRRGAYTWNPVELSEEHALRAIASGELRLTAPDGTPLRLRYERHVEHPDGNWTWVGRDDSGSDAVITFGEKAVFGSIGQPGREALRLMTQGGGTWLIETDPSKVADLRTRGPDYLIPPRLGAAAAASAAEPTTTAATTAANTATSATTVDVVLGYTSGFAMARGGDSQAVTRLYNLVEITNAAYANSQINARVRLVRTVRVDYPDTTSNGDTLAKLSGYQSGTGPIPVDPAFTELRAARDQYGADLVSLVRQFRTPENDGCGLAWLIGGRQSGMDRSDAPFGYSVVGDGTDLDESDNKTYFCREETLAHEFGHNMGQAHNREDTTGSGIHSYSYGYREASSTGFFTVMAYRMKDSSQFSIRHFANPNVTYLGRPTGVANDSDNARSLAVTIPIIATFRDTVVGDAPIPRPRNDIDGDGKSDLILRNGTLWAYWLMNGASVRQGVIVGGAGGGYAVEYAGDFNNDGRAEVVYKHPDNRNMWVWFMSASGAVTPTEIGTPPTGWDVFATADMNGDGKTDLVLRSGNQLATWVMNGATVVQGIVYSNVGTQYRPVQVGDFNGDGVADVIYTDGMDGLYLAALGDSVTLTRIGQMDPGYEPFAADDIDLDGRDDLLLRNGSSLAYWLLDGARLKAAIHLGSAGGTYRAVLAGDFDGDGSASVLFQNDSRHMLLWTLRSSGVVSRAIGSPPPGWVLLP